MEELSISLYYKDAKSDKEYHAQLVAQDGGFMVLAQNGRRGGTLVPRKKTASPVAYDVARKAYDKLVKEKLSEGYSSGQAGTVFTGGALEARFTGIVPQLLNIIDEEQAQALLADPDWVAEQKHDGHRRLVQRQGDTLVGINRKGLATGLPETVALTLGALSHTQFVVDGELMGDTMALFDLLELDGQDLRPLPFDERIRKLEALSVELAGMGLMARCVFVTLTARTEEDKRALYDMLKSSKAEGVVFKRKDAPYVPGKPNSGGNQLKRVFVHRASFLVKGMHQTKRSASLELLDETGALVGVGNCTVPSNYDIPEPGTIVDVEYLYAYRGGSIFQGRYKGARDDIERSACVMNQLVFKATPEDGADSDDPVDDEAATTAA